MGKATICGQVTKWNKTDSRELGREIVKGSIKTDIPLGNGKASVTQTRGFKTWYSDRSYGGLTVESTMSVTLTCGQSVGQIKDAAEEAGRLAEELADAGLGEMGVYIKQFQEDSDARSR